MQSRRDQVQAYFFTVGRLVSALMRGRPDERTTPTRRFATGTTVGVLIAAIIAAGFGITGAMRPGSSTAWQKDGTVTVEQETGARYVTLGGVLHPALNYSSALLASNQDYQQPTTVSQKSLRDAPRGAPLGIPEAPDSLPDPQDPTALRQKPWTSCVAAPDGAETPSTELHVGAPAGEPLSDDEGLVVATPDGSKYLVWHGKKLRIPEETAAQLSSSPGATPFPVAESWINAIPSGGGNLTVPDIPGIGSTTTETGDAPARVGTVYTVRDDVDQAQQRYFVALPDGLLPVNRATANLLLNDPKTAAAYPDGIPEPVRGGPELLSAPRSNTTLPPKYQDLPSTIRHRELGSNQNPCAAYDVSGDGGVRIRMTHDNASEADGAEQSGGADAESTQVSVPPGTGVLLREQAVPGGPPGGTYLVDDLGTKYALPPQAMQKLGYADASPVTIPSALLDVLPTGPRLDPARARSPQPAGAERD